MFARSLDCLACCLLFTQLLLEPVTSPAAIITTGDAGFVDVDLLVAQNGSNGSLTLTSPTALEGGGIFVAKQPEVSGTVIVDGAAYSGGGKFEIGQGGTGTLKIINGGNVLNSSHELLIGNGENANGEVVVSGLASRLAIPNNQTIVRGGASGSLIVEAGATALLKEIQLGSGGLDGRSSAGNGTATVRGVGSRLDVQESLRVGSGMLVVENGGQLVSGLANRNRGSSIGSINQRSLGRHPGRWQPLAACW